MNTLKKIGLTCLLVVIGWGTAAAATHTINISGMSGGTLTDDSPETSWTTQGGQSISFTAGAVKFSLANSGNSGHDKAYVYGTVPNTWRITSIIFTGGTANEKFSYTLTIEGTQMATQNNAHFTSVPNLIGPSIVFAISSGTSSGQFTFNKIQIEYTEVSAAPVLTYPDGKTGNNATTPYSYDAIPSSITIMADQVLYSGGVALTSANASGMIEIVDSETNAISGAITLTTVTSNANATTLTLDIDKSKLTNCQTYTLMVVSLPTNSDGVAVASNNSIWYFSTPTITASDLVISGTKEFLTGSTFDHNDWVITTKKGGVDITKQCTNFSNPNMTTAGTKDVTFDYAGCTITTTITITERATYTLTWKNLVTGEAEITTQVQQGNTVGTLPKPTQTTFTTACGEKRFVGWTTAEFVGSQDEAPTLVQSTAIPTANRTLYAVYADATGGSGDTWEKITSTAQLTAGKTYLIGNTDGTAVMGSASSNNFKQVGATASGNAITPASGYNAVILGGSAGAWTLQLAGNNEYLYAASPSSNYLRSRAGNDDKNSEWAIEIAANGDATVTAQGDNTHNMLRYNTSSSLFSCYSGTQQPVSFYLNTGGGTGFITKCDCTPLGTPTGLSATNASGASVDLSWTPVTGATSYLVEYSINSGSTWNSVECTTGTSYKLTGLNKSTNYTWRIVALSNDGEYCVKSEASDLSTFETTSNCAWQINYQPTSGATTWSEANCFSQVGNTNEWQLADFTLPASGCNFWVGPGKFDNTYSKNVTFGDNLTFAALQNTACGKPYPGENAVGTLRIYSDSKANNYFVGFMPTYQIAYGLQGSTWEHLPFAYVNVSGNTYETALTEVPNGYWNNDNYQFYVGAKKTDGGTNWIDGKSSTLRMKTMNGLNGANIGGAKGVYRIYDNSCDNNWYCAFIPYYNIVYYAADNTTVYQTSDYISFEKTDAERTINVLSNGPVKDGYRFIGWSHTAGGAKQVDPGSSYKLWKCNDPLYPVYIQQVTLNYNTTGGVSVCEANTIDINTKTTVCADAPTREGYKFTVWNTAQDGSGTTYAPGAEITLSENVTLYAQWLPYIKAYYDKTNITFATGCDASDKQVVKGDVITLCDKPTSPFGYTFTSWAINGNGGYNPGATYTVSGAELEIKITPVWNTPTHEFIFINQGAGTSQEVIISTVSGAEGTYITAPASCGTVPTNCEGKVFVGWLRGTYDGTLDGNEGVNTPEQLIAKAEEQNSSAGGVFFASPGQRIKVADQSAHEPENWGKWYAVFAIPE